MALKRRALHLSNERGFFAPRGLDRLTALRRLDRVTLIGLLAACDTLVLLAYFVWGQPLILLAAVAIAGGGLDGLIRTHPTVRLRGLRDTALLLGVPVLLTLGEGVFFRYTVGGIWRLPAALASGLLLSVVEYAQYRSLDADEDEFVTLRLVLNLAGYLAAFALYTSLYNQRLPLPVAAVLVGIVSALISVEILREVDLKTDQLLIYAATLGFVMVQARWALYFISLSGWLGGVFILVVFYVASQVLQSYLWGRLNRWVLLEMGSVGFVGAGLVIAGRLLSRG